ncbi:MULTISPECIES: helicase-related protein [Asticcacaulis]|uniref:helicase-related protein n=1 Tax=Asticcacaulis TaxID=76890 RepID=UPI001FD9DBFB|nr:MULTISPECIES: helicase-related protein [Asticcacaulis]MBP2161583.1 ATP-dependent RNA helicase SUPV3L1/SUV3 [Asticcacaulis solisilvae]MDR6802566.1 ATP-dependent RNA helicase SUPV3L1/SUV3 [Asticcacaulis sp. BE141]
MSTPVYARPTPEPSKLMAVLGPTNTGKTHYALERMTAHATGMIGLPLRLLAREIYERVVAMKGVNAVALITGEEKIIPRLPSYFVCTVEAMPLERQVDFLAVDEIQLCGDAERGHVFTDRLLHARGRHETLFLGAKTFAPLFRRLFPEAEVMMRERLSELSYSGPKKLTRLPKRSAIVAFSTEKVYAIAELIRRQRGGAAVVMGSLSPKTRNAQVSLFQNGEVEFLVATDAIGMGLNMDIAHVAFSGLSKFDGKSTRHLTAQEIGQIAGRAGRFTQSGTFGVTGECHDMDEDLVHAVEQHQFLPIEAAEWRNSVLDFTSLDALLKSLTLPSPQPGLVLAKEALDEKALRYLSQDEDIAAKVKNPVSLRILWEACQLPDFRKVGTEEYFKLVNHLFWSRIGPEGAVPEDWIEAEIRDLDKMEGDIDTLSSRLAGVRTLSYIANRGGWLKRTEHWREVTRDLEERLSDRLHEALMQRFIDTRTSALLKALNADEELRPEVTPEGKVIIEGHEVGELKGLSFSLSSTQSVIEDKTLRQAAFRAVNPLLLDRLRDLGNTASKALRIQDGRILWNKEPVAKIEPSDPFAPRIKLMDSADHPALRARAEKRVTDFVRQTSLHTLKSLAKVKAASENEATAAQVRAIAFQLYENGGVTRRDETVKINPEDRAALKALGVAGHRYLWFLPDLQSGGARHYLRSFGKGEGQRALSLQGQVAIGDHPPVSIKTLSQLDKIMGNGLFHRGALYIRPDDFAALGMDEKARDQLLQALGYVKVQSQSFPVVVKPAKVEAPAAEAEAEPVAEGAKDIPADAGMETAEPVIDTTEAVEAEAPAKVVAVEAPVETVEPPVQADEEALPVETTIEQPTETVEAAEPVMEERLGWRQKSLESRAPRPKRGKPQHKGKPREEAVAEDGKPARSGKPRHGKGDRKPGGKDRQERNKDGAPRGPRPENKPREPYVNPYSPFAILREKLGQG